MKAKRTYRLESFKILDRTSIVASNMIQGSINLDIAQENDNQEQESELEQEFTEDINESTPSDVNLFEEMDNEQRLHVIGYKKTSGKKLTEAEKDMLMVDDQETFKSHFLLKAAASLLKKGTMNKFEQSAMKLCLSKIINQVNPVIKSIIVQHSDPPPFQLRGMNATTASLFDRILSHSPDVDAMLSMIQSSKSNISRERKRLSEGYIMLNIIERVLENLSLWEDKTKESELTFCRAFGLFIYWNNDQIG